ncbi:DUF4177 domain-containing protein [Ammoniphilus resinae]|uniref:DUF4177 domain-containing protein n=1 Tax=Ammoniphilus resinae TaxID=861532 RepID=A0ABS4GX89_9BACL|nr:DUF4177 domain-containing protein [Ammoniphilus resinae]MBP1934895.1 hypothetical protein [Ammoniphilus resinae]
MRKWEYTTRLFNIEDDNDLNGYQNTLNDLGEYGWELVSAVNTREISEHDDGKVSEHFTIDILATFKREKY